ncbi:Uncharacterised protein [Klebsiella pneumoniae]|nr:Uncharacterised protein [Klebsiella pneumoniae]
MANKAAGDVKFVIKRFFERQKGQHQIGGSADFENAFLSPGPDRRADVVNGFDALLFQISFEGDIKVRGVDADEDIGTQLAEAAGQIGANME